jgi:hypothetical protein
MQPGQAAADSLGRRTSLQAAAVSMNTQPTGPCPDGGVLTEAGYSLDAAEALLDPLAVEHRRVPDRVVDSLSPTNQRNSRL